MTSYLYTKLTDLAFLVFCYNLSENMKISK